MLRGDVWYAWGTDYEYAGDQSSLDFPHAKYVLQSLELCSGDFIGGAVGGGSVLMVVLVEHAVLDTEPRAAQGCSTL